MLRRTLLPLLALALSGCGSNLATTRALSMRDVSFPLRDMRFPSGLRVVIEEDHRTPTVGVFAVVGSGSTSDPPGKEGLAQHLLQQKIEPPSHRLAAAAAHHLGELIEVAAEPDDLLGHVAALGEQRDLGLEPHHVDGQIAAREQAIDLDDQAPADRLGPPLRALGNIVDESAQQRRSRAEVGRERLALALAHRPHRHDRLLDGRLHRGAERVQLGRARRSEEIGYDGEERERDLGARRELVAKLA